MSGLGKIEHRNLAHRLTERLLPLLLRLPLNNTPNRIRLVSTEKSRTIASLNAFVQGLPSSLASLIDYEPSNPALLSFYENINYQLYFKKNKQLKAKLRSIEMQTYSKQMARNVLERIYKQPFIDKLINGDYCIIDNDSGKSIKNEVDAVRILHGLYLIGSNLREEGVEDLLKKYFHQNESAWFAYLHDAKVNIIDPSFILEISLLFLFFFKDYYEKGPGFTNRTITYDIAQILLDDFLLHSEKCSQTDATHFLRARFAHAETIIPFAALLQIPILSDKSTPFYQTFTYENNSWRGELVSPMTANIQWEIYRHVNYGKNRHNRHQQILIRMLYNEYPVSFKTDCKPYSILNQFFYTIDELKRCYKIANR